MKEYGKLCTIIYDIDKKFADTEEINLYTKHIMSKKDKILEPMCGSGRFYIPLLKLGYDITGFDSSTDMLDSCKKRCSHDSLIPNVFNSSMLKFNTIQQFDHIIIPIGSVSLLLEEDELITSFNNVYKSLNNKGYFVFSFLNFNNKDTEDSQIWTESMRYPFNEKEITCKQKIYFNKEKNIIEMKLLYELIEKEDVIEEEYQDFPMKLYNEGYIVEILNSIGFQNIEFLADESEYFSIIKCQKIVNNFTK